MADVVDIQTAAEQYTGKWDQDVVTGEYLDKNTQELAQALSKRQVPVVWNDLIREVERIRKRKNLSPLSASWHRNVGIAIKQCPFELAEATPEAFLLGLQRDRRSIRRAPKTQSNSVTDWMGLYSHGTACFSLRISGN